MNEIFREGSAAKGHASLRNPFPDLEANGRSAMWRSSAIAVSGLAIILLTVGRADAVGIGVTKFPSDEGAMVQRVHSLDEAEDTLHRRGYYDVRVERASLPYSFNACKRGVRYHIHVNYYGDLVQVDEVGQCRHSYNEGAYYSRRPYYDRHRDYYYDRYRDYRRRDY
jgi:hypothetical protein